MKLKAFKIWLYLVPLVALIGILLFVQSSTNQSELEQQHFRSIASLSKDFQDALPDYLKRVDAYFLREGYVESANETQKNQALSIQKILSGFRPSVSNLRFSKGENPPKVSVKLDRNVVLYQNHKVKIPPETVSTFKNAATKNTKFKFVENEGTHLIVDLEIPIDQLFGNLLANDFVFEKFFLTDSKGKIIYPDQSIDIQLFEPQDLTNDSTGITHSGIKLSRIALDGNEFQAYANPISLESNRLFLVGLYDSDYFLKVGLRINYNLLSTLLFILIVLLASIPILGVVKMGRGDNLTQARIIKVGISLMTLAVVMGFSLSFTKNRAVPEVVLADKIGTTSVLLRTTLDSFNVSLQNWKKTNNPTPVSQTNELIQINGATGFVNKIAFFNKESKSFGETFDFQQDNSIIYLKERNYYTFFAKKQNSKRFIDSHYSRGSGKLESVIALADTSPSPEKIDAVTFGLELVDTLSKAHRILLIKEDGKVIFKSKKLESSISKLNESISPAKWKEVSSLLKNNDSIHESAVLSIPLYLNGHQYEAVFKRIADNNHTYDQEIWQVFLVNSNIFHAFSALTSLEGIIYLVFYLGFFIFTLFAQWSTRTDSNSKGFKSFLFEWLVPNDKNKPRIIFLIFSYLVFTIVLFLILGNVALNPISTLALFTFSSLNISFVNLASAQLGDILSKKKKPTEVLVLLGILLLTFFSIFHFFSELTWPMMGMLFLTFLIILGWTILRGRQEKIPVFFFIKSSKSVLSAYLVFWFFLIGFLPGYLLQSKTQQFENFIWDASQTSELDVSNSMIKYEKVRRSMMATLADSFDSKIQDFIAPDQRVLRHAWEGRTTNLSLNYLLYLGFALLVFSTYLVIRWIQNSIFFDLKEEKNSGFGISSGATYLCCINSNKLPKPGSDTITIDLKYESFPDGPVDKTKNYQLVNFHCLENPMSVVEPISQIKKSGKRISVYSGTLWKNIYNGLKSEREKSVFSEVFSNFKFGVIKIKDVESAQGKTEEEVLAQLKRNKAFYANIWSDLSFEEKVVCNAYAMEGFFNPARKDTMIDLAQKGIIVPKTSTKETNSWVEWRLFSSVFRHFILTHSSEEETESFKVYEKKHGNVRTIQTAMISFVLICIALVGIFDKTFFNEAYTYLTGGLGILGTLYSFLSQGFAGLRGAKKEG